MPIFDAILLQHLDFGMFFFVGRYLSEEYIAKRKLQKP
jgi:hypothetical protein